MTVARASGDRIRLTSRSGRFFFRVLCYNRAVIQIPYAGIGIGIAIIFGVWAFIVAETVKERAVIAGLAILVFFVGAIVRSPAGQLISLIGWVLYGLGCIIFLRFNGMAVR